MQKRVFAVAIVLMVFVLAAVACGKKNGSDDKKNTEPFSYTTDADGTLYVTNVYGDLIPVTTGTDGSVELLDDLYTKTLAQVEEDKKNMENASKNTNNNEGETQGNSQNDTPTGGNTGSGNGIQVGSAEAIGDGKEAVIVW